MLTQYRPLELNAYIGSGSSWDLDRSDGGVHILPPYTASGSKGTWYKGTANAIYQNISFIERYDPEYVLVLSGDHIYKMDYSKMLEKHIEKGAACTISVIEVPLREASRFGIMNCDENDMIYEFEEKPAAPKSTLASMGIYVFTWKKLREYLENDETNENSENDFGKNVIPAMLAAGERMAVYRFSGYWKDVGTIDSLWDANMDLLSLETLDLFDPSWPIYAKAPTNPPQFIGSSAQITHSIVSEGCEVLGLVENSVLFSGAYVGSGAKVSYSLLMPGARVESGACVEYSIIAEHAKICKGARVGAVPPENPESWGIATCASGVTVAEGEIVPPNAMLYNSTKEVM